MLKVQLASCLNPFVETCLIIESNEDLVNRLLPDTAVVLAFRYKGSVNLVDEQDNAILPVCSVSGIRKTSKLVHYEENSGNIIIQFREGAAAAFFPFPVHELFDSNISLDQVFRASLVQELEEQVCLADTMMAKIKVIEQFLINRLPLSQPDLLIRSAIRQIKMAEGDLRIRQLAQSLHISQDAFEKRFRRTVGTTPKQFATIVRMKSLIRQAGSEKRLTDAAFGAGFFDQSHFIREFRKFAGQTPGDFFTRQSSHNL